MTTPPPNISVTLPVSQAIERVKRMLFKPFDAGKWFTIGFCAWLAQLGEAGFRGNYNFNTTQNQADVQRKFEVARQFVIENLSWILPLAIVVIIAGLALSVVFLWLSSRGKFMFLHCVALDKAEVSVPWQKFGRQANSLFLFRLVFGLIGLVFMIPTAVLAGVTFVRMFKQHDWNPGGIMAGIALVLLFMLICFIVGLIGKLTTDFVAPIMFVRGKSCLNAWAEFWELFATHFGDFVLYLLFQIVITIVLATMVIIVVLATCCIAGCFLALPYLGTVLLLPVLIFKRAYSLHYLAQFGREYDVFLPTA